MKVADTQIGMGMTEELVESETAANIGSILVNTGKISPKDAERISILQTQRGVRFGDAGKILGLINDNDIQKVLSYQFGFPYSDANDVSFSKELYAAYQPFCKQAETLRNLRNHLSTIWFTDTHKSLAIVSSGDIEGRSSLIANLAIIFSQLGQRTLLIDADTRKPRQHELFKLASGLGLTDILAERADLEVIAQIPVFHDLSVLPAGTVPPNPAELFSRGLKKCLKRLQPQFDIILIDTPSAEHFVDAIIVANICGGALLLARQHYTRLNNLQLLKSTLVNTGCKCLGAILTNF